MKRVATLHCFGEHKKTTALLDSSFFPLKLAE